MPHGSVVNTGLLGSVCTWFCCLISQRRGPLPCVSAVTPKSLALSIQDAHSQGEVVACLEKGLVKEAEENDPRVQVSDQCKKAILRVAELSSDDFHLDRHLYFACRDDRERFCENVSCPLAFLPAVIY